MMINDMKKNELTDQEMSSVAGGFDSVDSFLLWQQTQRELQKQEEARQKVKQPNRKPSGRLKKQISPAHMFTAAALPAAGKKRKTVAVSMAGCSRFFIS